MNLISTKDRVIFLDTFLNEKIHVEAVVVHTIDLETMDSLEAINIVSVTLVDSGQMLNHKTIEASRFRELLGLVRKANTKHF